MTWVHSHFTRDQVLLIDLAAYQRHCSRALLEAKEEGAIMSGVIGRGSAEVYRPMYEGSW